MTTHSIKWRVSTITLVYAHSDAGEQLIAHTHSLQPWLTPETNGTIAATLFEASLRSNSMSTFNSAWIYKRSYLDAVANREYYFVNFPISLFLHISAEFLLST